MTDLPIKRILLGEPVYPQRLAQIADPPAVLYVRGNTNLLNAPGIAIVGSRTPTPYGLGVTTSIARDIARAGVCIISGLALGVDGAAHSAALDAGGTTIAVLASGIDNPSIYPAEHQPLAQRILEKDGLLISEHPEKHHARKYEFPMRNRIMSALARGVVVTEANIKSGTLVTAKLAAEQGRDVFAVPGDVRSPRSAGPNWLIGQGAGLVATAADILERYPDIPQLQRGSRVAMSTQSPVRTAILAILERCGACDTDTIAAELPDAPADIAAELALMELDGIAERSGSVWRLTS